MNMSEPKFKVGRSVYWEILSSSVLWYHQPQKARNRINYLLSGGEKSVPDSIIYPFPDDVDDSSDPILLMRGVGIIKELIYIPPTPGVAPCCLIGTEDGDQLQLDLTSGGWIYKLQAVPCINPDAALEISNNETDGDLVGRYGQNPILDYLNYRNNATGLSLWLDETHLFSSEQAIEHEDCHVQHCFISPDPDTFFPNLYYSKLIGQFSTPALIRDFALPPSLFSIPQIYTQFAEIVTFDENLMDLES